MAWHVSKLCRCRAVEKANDKYNHVFNKPHKKKLQKRNRGVDCLHCQNKPQIQYILITIVMFQQMDFGVTVFKAMIWQKCE